MLGTGGIGGSGGPSSAAQADAYINYGNTNRSKNDSWVLLAVVAVALVGIAIVASALSGGKRK